MPPGRRCADKTCLSSVCLDVDRALLLQLDARQDGGAIQAALAKLTHSRTVPQVFIDGDYIGGGDDTTALASSGKLEIILHDKGIL